MSDAKKFAVVYSCGEPVRFGQNRVHFAWGTATQIIKADSLTQARRIASARWGKARVRSVTPVAA